MTQSVLLPAAALRQFIRYYVTLNDRPPSEGMVMPIRARTAPMIDFNFGARVKIIRNDVAERDVAHPVAVIGPQTYRRVQLVVQGGTLDNFVIVFQPGGLSRLFSVPLELLTNQDFEARSVFGRAIDELGCHLAESRSFAERIRCADQFFLTRCPATKLRVDICHAAREVIRHDGSLSIAVLAQRSGLSIRQFERRFVAQIGVSPKLYARVARFEAALKSKGKSPEKRWIEVAHELGYHDQMHMVRDFREFSEATPSSGIHQIDMFVTDEIEADALALRKF